MRPRAAARAPARWALTALLAAGAACAGGGAAGLGRGGGAPSYTARADAPFSPPAEHARLYAAVRAGGTEAERNLRPDAALAATAQAIAERVARDPQHRSPAASVIQALAWAAGLIDPVPGVVVSQMRGAPPLGQLQASVADAARGEGYTHAGVGVAPAGDGSEIVVVALSQRRVSLDLPVPRTLSVGERVRLTGRLAEGLRNPEIVLTSPNGRNEHFPLGDGPQFAGQFPAAERGIYQVELIAESEGGATVIANFPVYVAVPPPATPEAVAPARTESVAEAESQLLELINQSRRRAGLRPLVLMPALSGVARAHSEDMATHRFIAHNSRTSGTPADRLRRANLTSGLILENLGRGYSASEIHDGLMSSPGHRANIMNERVTHVGIGAATETGPGGGLVVTENFIQVADTVDLTTAPGRLLELINSARTRRGAQPVVMRPQLAETAQRTAQAFFQGRPSQQEIVDRANHELSRSGLIYRRVAVFATLVTRLTDAGGLEPLLDPGIGAIGVGVAQGSRPDTPPSAVFVVFVAGYPR